MVRIVVFGSRDFNDYDLMHEKLSDYFNSKGWTTGEVEIVEGGARGADRLAERFTREYGLKHTQFLADWETYGKSAGHIRNAEMAKYAQYGVGFWDGKSKGTEGMKNKMLRMGREVHIVMYDD